MQKWNMIIDVAECTNCQSVHARGHGRICRQRLAGLHRADAQARPKWINILQKERGQMPMIDIAYVPTMCNHCDNAPCIKPRAATR